MRGKIGGTAVAVEARTLVLSFLRAVMILIVVSLTAASPARSLDVSSLTYDDLFAWLGKSGRLAAAHFADRTFLIKVTKQGVGDMISAPPVGPLIVYLSKAGGLLSWNLRTKVVGTGSWAIKELDFGTQIPCLYFDLPGGKSDCFFGGVANYLQMTSGNPFGLKAGQAVPTKMTSSSTIATLAKKLKL
ncbi:MAG: hypothetical protein ABIO40_06270 [Devosia sp.]